MTTLVGALAVGAGAAMFVRLLLAGAGAHLLPTVTPRAGAQAPPVAGSPRRHRVLGARSRRDALGPVLGDDIAQRTLLRRQAVGAMLATAIVALLVAGQPSVTSVMAGLAAVAGAWQYPLIVARRRERERRTVTDRELTRALPELVMGVEAGLSLDSVMGRYADRHRSPLGDEFRRLALVVDAGSTRRDALRELSERTPTPIVAAFVSAVEQNLVLGTPLAAVLRKQAETVRRHRRQAAETRAAAVSMKMIFPTVFCILPVLMIVVVGPAIVRLVEVL